MSNKIDSWAIYFKSFNRLHSFMEAELKKSGFPSLEVYDVLWTLEQAPQYTLRITDLSNKVFLAKFNTSRIIDRLVKLKHVKKCNCPMDARGIYATLTPTGLKLRKSIWDSYKILINSLFSSKLNDKEHKTLKKILEKVYLK